MSDERRAEDHFEDGRASGWSVKPVTGHGWQWSAYGPHGSKMSTAFDKAQAERLARAAEKALRGPGR